MRSSRASSLRRCASIAFSTFAFASPEVSRSSARSCSSSIRAASVSRISSSSMTSPGRRRNVVPPSAPRRVSIGVTHVSSMSAMTAALPGVSEARDLVDEVDAHAGVEQVVHQPAEAADVRAHRDARRATEQPDEAAGDHADERSDRTRSAAWRTDTVPEASLAITVDAYRVMSPSRCRSLRAVSPSNAVAQSRTPKPGSCCPLLVAPFHASRWLRDDRAEPPLDRMSGRRPIRPIPTFGAADVRDVAVRGVTVSVSSDGLRGARARGPRAVARTPCSAA